MTCSSANILAAVVRFNQRLNSNYRAQFIFVCRPYGKLVVHLRCPPVIAKLNHSLINVEIVIWLHFIYILAIIFNSFLAMYTDLVLQRFETSFKIHQMIKRSSNLKKKWRPSFCILSFLALRFHAGGRHFAGRCGCCQIVRKSNAPALRREQSGNAAIRNATERA